MVLQQNCLSATTSPLYILKVLASMSKHLPADLSLSRSGLYLRPPRVSACSILQPGVQCAIAPSFHIRQRECSCSSWRRRCATVVDACLMLKAGVGTKHRGTSHRLPASAASAWPAPSLASPGSSGTEIGVLVHLGLPKILNEVLSVVAAKQFLSGHPWLFFLELFKNACNGAHHVVIL